jgi:hypothetical protein
MQLLDHVNESRQVSLRQTPGQLRKLEGIPGRYNSLSAAFHLGADRRRVPNREIESCFAGVSEDSSNLLCYLIQRSRSVPWYARSRRLCK